MITKAQSLDNFIDKSLYEKNRGYYQKKIEFGRRGDFITCLLYTSDAADD